MLTAFSFPHFHEVSGVFLPLYFAHHKAVFVELNILIACRFFSSSGSYEEEKGLFDWDEEKREVRTSLNLKNSRDLFSVLAD